MGWSCTKAASDTMDRLTQACVALTGSQNVFLSGGVRYFWEHGHEEFQDGHVEGEVFQLVGEDHCQSVCKFTIARNGGFTGGLTWMRRVAGSKADRVRN